MHNRNTLSIFADRTGRKPCTDWLEGLRNPAARRCILTRLRHVEQGNFGDYRALREGIDELHLTCGPGYRVYFGQDGSTIVVLLSGADKSSQRQDVARAIASWKEYEDHASI